MAGRTYEPENWPVGDAARTDASSACWLPAAITSPATPTCCRRPSPPSASRRSPTRTTRYKLTDRLPEAISKEFIAHIALPRGPKPARADAVLNGSVLNYSSNPALVRPENRAGHQRRSPRGPASDPGGAGHRQRCCSRGPASKSPRATRFRCRQGAVLRRKRQRACSAPASAWRSRVVSSDPEQLLKRMTTRNNFSIALAQERSGERLPVPRPGSLQSRALPPGAD